MSVSPYLRILVAILMALGQLPMCWHKAQAQAAPKPISLSALRQRLPVPPARNAFQSWAPIYMDFPLLGPLVKKDSKWYKLRTYFEVNPRLNNNIDGMGQLLVRSAVGVRLNRHLGVYAGYCWVTSYVPNYRQEQRIWQQAGFGYVVGKSMQVLHRFRLEERMIQHTDGQVSVRFRYMARAAQRIGETRWYLAGSNELFVNFNSVENGPQEGIDQNRIFGGLGRQVNDHLRIEIGYQNQYVCLRKPARDRSNHILFIQTFVDY